MEVVILVGIAGSGKTTVCKKLFPHHKRISLDEIKRHNRTKEYKLIEQNLQQENSIVIDDTNLTRFIRKSHLRRVKKYNPSIVAVFLDYSIQRIQMQNSKRERQLPDHVLFRMKKQLEPPSYDEGFDYIQTLNDSFSF